MVPKLCDLFDEPYHRSICYGVGLGTVFCLYILSYAVPWFIAGKHHSTSFSVLRNLGCDFCIDWFGLAGLDFRQSKKGLSLADSNSCVQAAIDGTLREQRSIQLINQQNKNVLLFH